MLFRARVHIIFITFFAAASSAFAQQSDNARPQWEQIETSASSFSDDTRGADRDGVVSVNVHDMHIYVELDRPTAVKLFTILGQPVAQMNLPAGLARLRVPARGIYILKTGSATRRITI